MGQGDAEIDLPAIGCGTFPLKAELESALPCAVEAGCRLVDTADNYQNEEFVGRGFARCDASRVMVVTKFSQPLRTDELGACFEESLVKIGLGRIDAYLLHWPYPFLWKRQWRQMEDLFLSGRCRMIGVCNFEAKHLSELLGFCRVKPMIDQFELHPLFQQRETVSFCRRNGIRVMSYSPFARMDERLMGNPVLTEIANAHGKSVGQVILRWNLQHGFIPIPASKAAGHIRENLDVFDFRLADAEMERIDGLEEGHRVRFDPNTRFDRSEKFRFLRKRLALIGKGERF